MIKSLKNSQLSELESYPVCVVGGGAAGITMAIALARKGQRVLLIEGGDWKQVENEDAYMGEAVSPHASTTEYRYQRLGGTTHLWGGRCVPLDAYDLKQRDYVPNSGWPIEANELFPFYSDALDYCDAGNNDFTIKALRNKKPMFEDLKQLDGEIKELIERYSLPTDFAKKFGSELKLSKNILVLKETRVTTMHMNESGTYVDRIELNNGVIRLNLKVKQVVIAGGGIESTRLMLATRKHTPSWTRFDASLGKFYACHYDLIFGSLRFNGSKPFFDFEKTVDGIYARRKLQFKESFLDQHRLLNSTFRLHFPAYADASHGSGVLSTIYLAKSVLAKEYQAILNHGGQELSGEKNYSAHMLNVMTDAHSVAKFGMDWIFKRQLAKRKLPYTLINNKNGTYPLEFNSEQVPDKENKISLLDATDQFGMPRVKVEWRMTSQDINSGIRSFELLKSLLDKTKDCRLEFDAKRLENSVSSALPVGGHHIGSTRMGDSEDKSVVDNNCQVHGVNNLFIASSSVFPTNGHANPTLTIVALSLRLASHLHTQILKT
ncbi:GMC oxidoreductase [Methylophilus sp. DW102]|uniref:GMC oxidoreductase n=1 Tax=Methylophilus sp. DW102 TaxID=3095607 RepID=UPI0030891117|nr:FAD-dependent oxidoreductase [Methylophilus sp. DW102]